MENKKTISYLNSKTWYRLLKVVYLGFFIVALIVGNFVILEISNNSDLSKPIPTDPTNINQLPADSYRVIFQPLTEGQYNEAVQRGWSPDQIIQLENWRKEITIKGGDAIPLNISAFKLASQQPSESPKSNLSGLPPPPKGQKGMTLDELNAKLAQQKNKTDNILHLIEYFLIGNLIIIVFFEAMKRSFYYVFLGSLRPEK